MGIYEVWICKTETCDQVKIDFKYKTTNCGYRFYPYISNFTGIPTGYIWDFGDGNTSTDKYPTHHYQTTGTYVVTLKIIM